MKPFEGPPRPVRPHPARLSAKVPGHARLPERSYGLAPPDLKRDDPLLIMRDLIRVMPGEHLELLDDLRLSFACGDFFFVHAGVRPGVPLKRQRAEDLLWIRDDFLPNEGRYSKIIVHGHTPVPQPDVCRNRINIDTGAYATGQLTCLVLEANQMWFI